MNAAAAAAEKKGKASDKAGEKGFIALDSFVTYKADRSKDGFEFFPAPRAVSRKNGRTSIVLGDVPLPEGVVAPKNALTMLYGFKDSLEEMKRQYQRAAENDMDLVKVSMRLHVGEIIPGSTTMLNIGQTRFLNLRRADEELLKQVTGSVNNLLETMKKSARPVNFVDSFKSIAHRPDIICDAIRATDLFRHINAVVYEVPDGTRGRQVASIFSSNVVDLSFRGEGAFDIELPQL